jgi:thiamine biosynthesis lipoprotein
MRQLPADSGLPGSYMPEPADDADPAEGRYMSRRSFRAMGCQMHLTLRIPPSDLAEAALDNGQRFVERAEACLSRFRPDSELSWINDQAGSRSKAGCWMSVSSLFRAVLRAALHAARLTGGLCTPTILDALEAAGYDRDLAALTASDSLPVMTDPVTRHTSSRPARLRSGPRQVHRRALRPAHQEVRGRQQWRRIRLNRTVDRVWLPGGVRLDLAGVAKGWTADRVADLLAPFGSCLVDVGGDLAARLAPGDGEPWPIAIANPRQPELDLALVLLRNHGIATSGTDYRRWLIGGRPRHHLIDPRTGEPSGTDVFTATVIADSTYTADIHAKAALLLGASRGAAYLTRRRLAGLIVRRDGAVLTTPRWSTYAYTAR